MVEASETKNVAVNAPKTNNLCTTVIATKKRDFKAEHKKMLADDAFRALVAGQSDMSNIHNPRQYTRHQNNLMSNVVTYLFGPRSDIMISAGELTENIAMIESLAPSDISNLSDECKGALVAYGKVKLGIMNSVSRDAKGYELICTWFEAVYEYAKHTGQLEEVASGDAQAAAATGSTQ